MNIGRICGCFMHFNNTFLILCRSKGNSQENTWGLVAGGVHEDESPMQAMLREINEETGYDAKEKELIFLGEFFFEFPDSKFQFYTYRLKLKTRIPLLLNPKEHTEYRWVTPEECYAMNNLIHGFHELLEKTGYIDTHK